MEMGREAQRHDVAWRSGIGGGGGMGGPTLMCSR